MAALSTPQEAAFLIFQDSGGQERPDCVMLDPGASAFLSGYGPFRRLIDHYKDINFPVEVIKMTKVRRRLQFGGDASPWSEWSAHIPIFVDGCYGTIEIFLLPGNRRLKIGSSPWQPAVLGRQGEYLWPLTGEYDVMQYNPNQPEFALRTNDPDVHQKDGYNLKDFMMEEQGFTNSELGGANAELAHTKCLRRHELKIMDVTLTTQINELSVYIARELHRPERSRVLRGRLQPITVGLGSPTTYGR